MNTLVALASAVSWGVVTGASIPVKVSVETTNNVAWRNRVGIENPSKIRLRCGGFPTRHLVVHRSIHYIYHIICCNRFLRKP